MDTLDKIIHKAPVKPSDLDHENERLDIETVLDDASEAVEKINWWKVAGYAAAGLAVVAVAGSYAYWQSQQKKPLTRLERLKGQLGLANVDLRHLKSTIRKFDAEELKNSGRQLGLKAKKVTHDVSQRVAELTN